MSSVSIVAMAAPITGPKNAGGLRMRMHLLRSLYHTKSALARWNRARARKKGVSTYGKLTTHIVPERM